METDLYSTQYIATQPEDAFSQLKAQLPLATISLQKKAELSVLLSEIADYIDQPDYIIQYAEQGLTSGLLDNKWHTRALINKAKGYYQLKDYEQFLVFANMAVINAEQFDLPMLKVAGLVERAFAYALLKKEVKANTDIILVSKYLKLLPNPRSV